MAFMDFEIQAHRGARLFFPENTLQAFFKAADLGVRVVELDLVVSKDNKIVVSHDPWLSGPCTEGRLRSLIFDMAYSDIASCKPLLSTIFTKVDAYMVSEGMNGQMVYNLEIKSWPDKDRIFHPAPDLYADLVLQLIADAGVMDRVRIQSFDYRVIREAWKLNSQLSYGLLIEEAKNMEPFLHALGFVPQYVNPHFSLVDREMTDYLHAKHIRMIPWRVNRTEDMKAMKQLGAEGIITDDPEQALSLFGLQEEVSD